MAYDEKLVERIRDLLADESGLAEKRMFGGLAFMVRGNMTCGVVGDELMLRVGAERHELALTLPHAREMDFTGKPMKGFVFVAPEGIKTARLLSRCVKLAQEFARTLPAKKTPAKKAAKPMKR